MDWMKINGLYGLYGQQITENFCTEDSLQDVQTFFTENPFPGTERSVKQSLESIRVNIDWLSRDLQSIHTFLTKRS